jgi:hypothetical protein
MMKRMKKDNIEPSNDVSVNVEISEGDTQEKKGNPEDVPNTENIETGKQVTTNPHATEPKAGASDKTKPSSMGAHAGWDPDIKKKIKPIPKGWQLITV